MSLIRRYMQVHAFIATNLYMGFLKTKQVYQGALKSTCVPFLNCQSCPGALFSCPIGILQHFMTIHRIPYTLLSFLFSIGILVGSMACGWLCPFGLLQELLYKIKSFKIKIPKQLSILRYFSFFFLVLLIPFITRETWFSKLCPMGTLQAALPWVVWNPVIPEYQEAVVAPQSIGTLFVIKLLILIFFIALFVISKRPFCRIVCPLGAIFGVFNKYSLLKLDVDTKKCGGCNDCVESCPVELNVGKDANATTCVRCFKCLECESVKIHLGGMKEISTAVPETVKPMNRARTEKA